MPQPRPPGTLKQQCIRNIARNMDNLWAKDYIKNWHTQSKSLAFVLGPFEDLPGTVVELLIEELSNSKKLRKHHLQILLVFHLERLVLKRETDLEKAIALLVSRCKNLRHLGLKSNALPHKLVTEAFMSLKHLQSVDLSRTNVADDSISVLGSCSKHLRILNLSDSTATDKAIVGLVYGYPYPPSDPSKTTDLAKTLIQLNVYGSLVTATGLQCALIFMPNLQELNHSGLLSITAEINDSEFAMQSLAESRDHKLPDLPTLNLKHLQCDEYGFNTSNVCFDANLISSAVRLCPLVRYVHFGDLINLKRHSLLPLLNLNEVEELMLHFEEGNEVNFYEQILPQLLKFGPDIRKLQLRSVHKTNIAVIACLCSELQVLRLEANSYYCQNNPFNAFTPKVKVKPSFQHLRIANVNNEVGDNLQEHVKNQIPSDSLKLLLDAPRLEEVLLIDQDGLTDEILIDAAHTSRFPNLKTVHFVVCNNLTVHSIWALIRLTNPLSSLRLIDCKEITVNDYKKLQKFVERKKFTLEVVWS